MEANQKTVNIVMDGKELTVPEGITVLEAAQRNGIPIPTLCYHPALSNWGGCRMCVVEIDNAPRLAASCVTPVRDGMEVVTTNERILESRRTILEFLFLGGEAPPCEDAADTNDDGELTLTDPIKTLHYLFLGGTVIKAPGVNYPWFDPTPDGLACLQ